MSSKKEVTKKVVKREPKGEIYSFILPLQHLSDSRKSFDVIFFVSVPMVVSQSQGISSNVGDPLAYSVYSPEG